MRIEHLFSKLESRTSSIFAKIHEAITGGYDYVDMLEKDIHVLFKFMMLASRRSQHYRDEVKHPYRENDFLFQWLFETARKNGRSDDPGQFWLEHLLYLLETSHEDLLAHAESDDVCSAADTYKYFWESYSMQIWKAADHHEYFLNERLVDFEGDTQSFLGAAALDTGHQLTWMTAEDLIHMILPISPEVAVIFCNEARCWESPFADTINRYPENSLLKAAPHKDIIDIHVPGKRRGRKTWPSTVAWRVNIGTLSQAQHRIIASYSLSHAQSLVIVRCRERFERARKELELFSIERSQVWQREGIRCNNQDSQRRQQRETQPTEEQFSNVVDIHMTALEEIINVINQTDKRLQRTKDNACKSWLAIRACEAYRLKYTDTSSTRLDAGFSKFRIMHPALEAAFEAAYPPQHPNHKDLITIDFRQFLSFGIGEETFKTLTLEIDKKISELVHADVFHTHWESAATESYPHEESMLQTTATAHDQPQCLGETLLAKPSFQSVYRAAYGLDVLKWMFEERQDILATFVRRIAVPPELMQPRIIRIRSRRE